MDEHNHESNYSVGNGSDQQNGFAKEKSLCGFCALSPVITDVFTSPPQLMDHFLKGNRLCLSSDHRAVG